MADEPRPTPRVTETTEASLDNERMGRNALQGNDQHQVRNERQAMPEERSEPDDVVESFAKLDKEKRAKEDLGKGSRRS